tara:strand:- start:452 stop:1174 length:723 start_codon:yes stop_codon:yes gene_type:complete
MVLNLANLNQDVLDIIKSMDLKNLKKEIQNDYLNCIDKMDNSYHYYERNQARQYNSQIIARCEKIRDEKLKSMKSRKAKIEFLLKQRSPERSFTKKKSHGSPNTPNKKTPSCERRREERFIAAEKRRTTIKKEAKSAPIRIPSSRKLSVASLKQNKRSPSYDLIRMKQLTAAEQRRTQKNSESIKKPSPYKSTPGKSTPHKSSPHRTPTKYASSEKTDEFLKRWKNRLPERKRKLISQKL